MKNKTLQYLINEIVELRIKEDKLEKQNYKLENEKKASDNIILNYKQEIANLRVALSTLQKQETNTKEKTEPEVIITNRDDK
jgi:uncharacterized membrane-anchored protein